MTQEEFMEAAGVCGEYLYFILQSIRSQGKCPEHRASRTGARDWDQMTSEVLPHHRIHVAIFY